MSTPTTIACILLSLLVLTIPRKSLLFPLIIAVCLVPMKQRLIIAGIDFPLLRILMLVCMLRLFIRKETRQVFWNSFDKLILQYTIVSTIIYLILWGPLHSFIYKCGTMYDTLGLYWIFRQYMQSFDDINEIVKGFAISAIVSAPLIAAEKIIQTSIFSIFGPVSATFHHGRFRCAGPFSHFIIMGVFWSSTLPLFYARIKEKSSPFFYWTAIFAALTCVYYSASSTPIMTIMAIIIFGNLYTFRAHGKEILWFICFVLFILHFAMKAPVWHLLARVDIFGGSTGWFRYFLFDQFIKHTSEWLFIGTKSTAHWGRGLFDLTNQYVLVAVQGGIVSLFLFIRVLYNAVKITGKYSLLDVDSSKKFISWGVCVGLLGHIVTFWGVSYFAQMDMLLILTFAIVGFIEEETIKYNDTLD